MGLSDFFLSQLCMKTLLKREGYVYLLDLAIGKIKAACDKSGYVLFITADHGNAEKMYSDQGGPHTAHTTYRGKDCPIWPVFLSLISI